MESKRVATIVDRDTARRALSYLEGVFLEKEIYTALSVKADPVYTQAGHESADSIKQGAAWDRANNICRGLIRQLMTPDDCDATGSKTAVDLISFIQEKYIVIRQQSSFADAVNTLQSTSLSNAGSESWEKTLEKINKIETAVSTINKLDNKAIGNLGPIYVCQVILNALPRSFSAIKQHYLERDLTTANWSINNVKSSIESACRSHNPQRSESRNSNRSNRSTSSNHPTSSDYGTCKECGREHSLKSPCRAPDHVKKMFKETKRLKTQNDKIAAKLSKLSTSRTRRPASAGSSSSKSNSSLEAIVAKVACPVTDPFSLSALRASIKRGKMTLDSAASAHLTPDLSSLVDVKELSRPIELEQAARITPTEAGAPEDACVTHIGTLHLRSVGTGVSLTLPNVYWGKDLTSCLISVSTLDDLGYHTHFGNGKGILSAPDKSLVCEATKLHGIYIADLVHSSPPSIVTSVPPSKPTRRIASQAEAETWHRRLGHINWKSLSSLSRKDPSMPLITVPKSLPFCDACQKGKQSAKPISSITMKIASEPLQLVHTDLCGPYGPSLGEAQYIITFTDDYSRYSMVYFLTNKLQALSAFNTYRAEVERIHSRKIKLLRMDNGGEYTSEAFQQMLNETGIEPQYTAPDTPQLNGVSERLNRTLNDKMRSLLCQSKLPHQFWAEAMRVAVAVKNRTPTRTLDVTPHEAFTGKPADLSKIKTFGSIATVLICDRKKVDPKSKQCIVLSYAGHGTMRLYDIEEEKIIIAAYSDCTFFESVFAPPNTFAMASDLNSDSLQEATAAVPLVIPKVFGPIYDKRRPRIKKGNRKAIRAFLSTLCEHIENDDVPFDQVTGFLDYGPMGDPKSQKAAYASKYADKWKQAELEELQSMKVLKAYKAVRRPKGAKVIPLKWVYRTKQLATLAVRFKARLVARGDLQSEDTFSNTFSPVAKLASIRMILALAIILGLEVRQWDFLVAFLQAKLKEQIYVSLPPGYSMSDPLMCWLILVALYGLRQAAMEWYDTVTIGLKSLGWHQLSVDHAVYRHDDGSLMAVWIDDCVLACQPGTHKAHFDKLASVFRLKDLGEIDRCLGLEIKVNLEHKTISVTQAGYVATILQEWGFEECTPRQTPMLVASDLDDKERPPPDSADARAIASFNYRKLIGKLIYLVSCTRPDIAFAVNRLAQFCSNPGTQHVSACKHLLRYLSSTPTLGLHYDNPSQDKVIGYSDANWGGDKNYRSTTGYVFLLCGSPISWNSKKQPTVALSTTEAEYMGLSETVKESIWLTNLANELLPACAPHMSVRMDNKSAISLSKNDRFHNKSKHISLRHHFLREKVADESLQIKWIPTAEMAADCLTKAVSRAILLENIRIMGLA